MCKRDVIACLFISGSLIWHLKLGHINVNKMRQIVSIGLLPNLHNEFCVCENCLLGKMTSAPFGKSKRTESLLKIVQTDICSPINVKTQSGTSYFIPFIDDCFLYG